MTIEAAINGSYITIYENPMWKQHFDVKGVTRTDGSTENNHLKLQLLWAPQSFILSLGSLFLCLAHIFFIVLVHSYCSHTGIFGKKDLKKPTAHYMQSTKQQTGSADDDMENIAEYLAA